MARSSAPHASDFDTLVRELLVSHATGQAGKRQEDEIEAALTDALTEALRRMLSRATPIERALFVESLAPALAEALAPALAEALAPALAEALGDVIAQSKATARGKSAPSGEAPHGPGAGDADHEREQQ
jgi:hypothetical protein